MSAIAKAAPPALYPDTPRSPYSPGPVRRATDAEGDAVAAFVARYPEFGRLSHEELVTLAATYVGPERAAENAALEDGGVPLDWQRQDDNEEETR